MVENNDYFLDKWKKKKDDENVLVIYKAPKFIKILERAEMVEKFDIEIYFKIIEKMIVFEDKRIIVTLLDGTEIECEIE